MLGKDRFSLNQYSVTEHIDIATSPVGTVVEILVIFTELFADDDLLTISVHVLGHVAPCSGCESFHD